MATVVLVWVGGFLGSIIRYLISRGAQDLLGNPWFPYGTLAVNVIGCIIIGILAGVVDSRGTFSPETRALLFIGFLGGFTTFSAFGYETFGLARDGKFLGASANVALQLSRARSRMARVQALLRGGVTGCINVDGGQGGSLI